MGREARGPPGGHQEERDSETSLKGRDPPPSYWEEPIRMEGLRIMKGRRELVFSFRPIGIIRSPYHDPEGMPIQPKGACGVPGTVEVFEEYRAGLADLEGFSRIILIYPFYRSTGYSLVVTPFLDTRPRGLFSTRAPRRPNAIGLSIVRLVGVDRGHLTIEDVDILDGTPLLDIKPYVPAFDSFPDERSGWLSGCDEKVTLARSDGRFRDTPGDS